MDQSKNEVDVKMPADDVGTEATASVERRGGRSDVQLPFLFPSKLRDMLRDGDEKTDDTITSVVSWLPDGKAFKVHDVEVFVQSMLPTYFNQSKYKSFQRQLNLWDFDRITKRGPEKGAYFHAHFQRDKPLDYEKLRRVRAIKKVPARERRRLEELKKGNEQQPNTSVEKPAQSKAAADAGPIDNNSRRPCPPSKLKQTISPPPTPAPTTTTRVSNLINMVSSYDDVSNLLVAQSILSMRQGRPRPDRPSPETLPRPHYHDSSPSIGSHPTSAIGHCQCCCHNRLQTTTTTITSDPLVVQSQQHGRVSAHHLAALQDCRNIKGSAT